ncbi:MAG: hypothetical protein SF182_30440 [Deltaproteobacteria bacterium]|nr:hypothetical protein [Deltaproteobacteria bacterium]
MDAAHHQHQQRHQAPGAAGAQLAPHRAERRPRRRRPVPRVVLHGQKARTDQAAQAGEAEDDDEANRGAAGAVLAGMQDEATTQVGGDEQCADPRGAAPEEAAAHRCRHQAADPRVPHRVDAERVDRVQRRRCEQCRVAVAAEQRERGERREEQPLRHRPADDERLVADPMRDARREQLRQRAGEDRDGGQQPDLERAGAEKQAEGGEVELTSPDHRRAGGAVDDTGAQAAAEAGAHVASDQLSAVSPQPVGTIGPGSGPLLMADSQVKSIRLQAES